MGAVIDVSFSPASAVPLHSRTTKANASAFFAETEFTVRPVVHAIIYERNRAPHSGNICFFPRYRASIVEIRRGKFITAVCVSHRPSAAAVFVLFKMPRSHDEAVKTILAHVLVSLLDAQRARFSH